MCKTANLEMFYAIKVFGDLVSYWFLEQMASLGNSSNLIKFMMATGHN